MRLRAPPAMPSAFERDYKDLDLVAAKGASRDAGRLLQAAGYEPHVSFNALNSKERLLFFDEANGRQVDVFIGAFRMCHAIPLDGRIEVDRTSIPLAELLLTKLQVIELNEKDVRDALALLWCHPVGQADGEELNGARVAQLCADDWGLWRTITANLETCAAHVDRYEVDGSTIGARVAELRERIEAEPKSRGWRLRAKIGERKRWYEVPEEVG
ncbi:MAG TPA: hypothetical protein VGF23_19740 [Gaiellaceae bacterium]